MQDERSPQSSADLGLISTPLHGDGQRYRVNLGTQGFWIIDTERRAEDGTVAIEAGCFHSKSAAREECDLRNDAHERRRMASDDWHRQACAESDEER